MADSERAEKDGYRVSEDALRALSGIVEGAMWGGENDEIEHLRDADPTLFRLLVSKETEKFIHRERVSLGCEDAKGRDGGNHE